MIAARKLRRHYLGNGGELIRALDGVCFNAQAGQLVVVRGPSGCGKSTLLNLLGLLDRPTSGSLVINGVETSVISRREAAVFRRATLGFLFQDAGLIEPMTVSENVALPLAYIGVSNGQRLERVVETLGQVGLTHRQNASVSTLSGGERLRAGLARALVTSPKLLICDEPTASLDASSTEAMVHLLQQRAREGGTVVCSSHDPILVKGADKVVSLSHGQLAEEHVP